MGCELILDRNQNEMKFPFEKAYARVVDVEVSAERDEAHIHVAIYADQAARDSAACSILKKTVMVKLSDLKPSEFSKDGVKAAAWEYLNTQKITFAKSPMQETKIEIDFSTGKAVL